MVAAFESVGGCVKVSLLCETCVLGYFLILLCERPYTFIFRSASFVIWYCLMDESASTFNPLAISFTACLFDLIYFDFLSGATTVLCFFPELPD